MELEKEIAELRVQVAYLTKVAEKALMMAIDATAEVKGVKNSTHQVVHAPASPELQKFVEEMTTDPESEPVPQAKEVVKAPPQKLSPFTMSGFRERRLAAVNSQAAPSADLVENEGSVWDEGLSEVGE